MKDDLLEIKRKTEGDCNLKKTKYKLGFVVLLGVILILLAAGCSSKHEGIQPVNANQQAPELDKLLSLEEAKRIILQAEQDLTLLKEQEGDSHLIGHFGVSPVYSLASPSRQELENALSKYFSQELMKYVLITHEIVCTETECGNYGDSEGQYVVNTEGNFEMLEQTEQRAVIQVPFTFEGINENNEFPDTTGTYTFVRQSNGGFLITDISQEYNDQLYNYEEELLVDPDPDWGMGTDEDIPYIT